MRPPVRHILLTPLDQADDDFIKILMDAGTLDKASSSSLL